MKEILFFLALAAALNPAQKCFPPSCRIDANCVDTIHSLNAKCCGGVCVQSSPSRLIGELCDAEAHETCFGSCAPGSFCSAVDQKCHANPGAGCSCTTSISCTSGTCVNATTTSPGFCVPQVPLGAPCNGSATCATGVCNNTTGVCAYVNPGDPCAYYSTQCGPNGICNRYNASLQSYVCAAFCALNTPGCCVSNSDCPNSRGCNTTDRSCMPLLELGEVCAAYSDCANSTYYVLCAPVCNSTGCGTEQVCQNRNQIAVGQSCSQSAQCVVNSSCFNSTCIADNSVPLGQACSQISQCAAPGNICSNNNQGDLVCKTNGSTPIGSRCVYSYAIEECVAGAECWGNGSTATVNYTCTPKLSSGTPCVRGSGPGSQTCINGTCVPPQVGSSTCSLTSSNCSCATNRAVADGGACTSATQCQVDSYCDATSSTCRPVVGKDCVFMSDCGYPKYDCSCDRKCYLLNPPTPPVAPSPAPVGPCDAKRAAWLAVEPSGWTSAVTSANGLQNVVTGFAVAIASLSTSSQALAIDYVCCASCPSNSRFNSYIVGGYQVDCAAKTLTKLPDTCDNTRAALGFLNCWTTTSAAPAVKLGLGMFAALVASMF